MTILKPGELGTETSRPAAENDRCVAMLDILGFRERLRRGELVRLAELLDGLVANIPRITMHWSMSSFGPRKPPRSMSGRERMHTLLFSDTLLLWSDPMPKTPERREARAVGFLSGVAYVIGGALLNGVPLRAGVAYGPVLVATRKRIVIGQPIVDAYLTEGVQEWVGGAIHESYPYYGSSYECRHPVPVKDSSPFALERAVDWTMPGRVFDTETKRAPILPRLERALQAGMDSASSERIRRKYANAAAFMRAVEESREDARIV